MAKLNEVVHFEIPAGDVERAKKFYKATFGWKMNDLPEMYYTIVGTAEVDENNMLKKPGAINGGMMKRSRHIRRPVITISVESIEAALRKVEKNGGSALMGKTPVGDMGWSAYFKDSEGNPIGLWQNKES